MNKMNKRLQFILIIASPFLVGGLLFGAVKGLGLHYAKERAKEREAFFDTMSERAETILEERYGEPFVSTDFHNVVGPMYGKTVYYSGTCAPARDESLKFKVDMEKGEDGKYYITAEHYAAQTANCELSREISEEFTDLWGNFHTECEIICPVDAKDINDETTIQAIKDGKLDWQSYMRNFGTIYNDALGGNYHIDMYILVDDSSVECSPGEEYDAIVKAVEKYREIVSPDNVRFSVSVYTAPREAYNQCVDILNSHRYAYVSARYILDIYDVVKDDGRGHFVWMNEIYVSDGEPWTLDRQGYIEKRTAVFAESDS